MNKVRSILSITLVIISLFAVFTTSSVAAESPKTHDSAAAAYDLYQRMLKAEDLDAFFAKLSPSDRGLAIQVLTPVSTEVDNSVNVERVKDSAGSRTTWWQKSLSSTKKLKNIWGMTLAKYKQVVVWTYDGTYIVLPPEHYIAGTTEMVGWVYNGVAYYNETGGQGYTYYYAYSQGMFAFVIAGQTISTWYPAIGQKVYGDGTWEAVL